MSAGKSNSDIVSVKVGENALGINLSLPNLSPAQAVSWLEHAIPQYEQQSRKTAFMAVAIGYALIVVRDFGERGSLSALKKLGAFNRCGRTLERCMKAAQKFIEAAGLVNDELKLKAAETNVFQSEFDFAKPDAKDGILAKIAEFVGDSTITDLIADQSLGLENGPTPPQGHQGESAKKRTKQTPEQIARDEFNASLASFKTDFSDAKWHHLTLSQREKLMDWLADAARQVKEHNKTVNRQRLK